MDAFERIDRILLERLMMILLQGPSLRTRTPKDDREEREESKSSLGAYGTIPKFEERRAQLLL